MPLHARSAPARRPAKRRPRLLAAFMALLLFAYLIWSFVAIPHMTYQGKADALTPDNTGAMGAIAWPAYGQAALATTDGGVLATNGTQTSVPIASIAKVMLALSVLREKPFNDGEQGETLTLTQSDVDIYNHFVSVDGSVALVAAGEQLTEYQALEALLLPSANNMADSLAVWVFGSVQNYADYANQYASQLGLSQTHFVDASGFDPGTVSSAVNLVRLGQLAMKNSVIADIVSQPTATIPVAGTIHNVNWLLGTGDGFIGLKTGNTDQAGGCMLWAAEYSVGGRDLTIIGAILGAPNLQASQRDSIPLLASAKRNFIDSAVVTKGQVVGSYATPWGGRVNAVAADTLHAIVWKGVSIKPEVVMMPLQLPVKSGQVVGKVVSTTSSGIGSGSVPVTLTGDLQPPSWGWRITHPAQMLHAPA